MNRQSAQMSLYLSVLGALTALLSAGTFVNAQGLYQLDWGGNFNTNAAGESEDNWVANSFTVSRSDRTHLVSIILPIAASFTNQAISALVYKGSDVYDPTAGGGLVLLSKTDTTITTTPGSVVTLTLDTPVDLNVGDVFYAGVLIPGVGPGDQVFPFYADIGSGSGIGGLLQTQPLGRSFFDTGLTVGGAYDVNQGSANVTVLGGNHPVVGPGIQSPGNFALWVYATASP